MALHPQSTEGRQEGWGPTVGTGRVAQPLSWSPSAVIHSSGHRARVERVSKLSLVKAPHVSFAFCPVSILRFRTRGCVPEIIKTTHLHKHVAGFYGLTASLQPALGGTGRQCLMREGFLGLKHSRCGEGRPEPVQMMDLLSPPR